MLEKWIIYLCEDFKEKYIFKKIVCVCLQIVYVELFDKFIEVFDLVVCLEKQMVVFLVFIDLLKKQDFI